MIEQVKYRFTSKAGKLVHVHILNMLCLKKHHLVMIYINEEGNKIWQVKKEKWE